MCVRAREHARARACFRPVSCGAVRAVHAAPHHACPRACSRAMLQCVSAYTDTLAGLGFAGGAVCPVAGSWPPGRGRAASRTGACPGISSARPPSPPFVGGASEAARGLQAEAGWPPEPRRPPASFTGGASSTAAGCGDTPKATRVYARVCTHAHTHACPHAWTQADTPACTCLGACLHGMHHLQRHTKASPHRARHVPRSRLCARGCACTGDSCCWRGILIGMRHVVTHVFGHVRSGTRSGVCLGTSSERRLGLG